MSDDYSPTLNMAQGYTLAIDAVRTSYEAEREKRPDLTAEQYSRERGGYLAREPQA